MNFKIAIPSKGRSEYIKTKTLELLEKHSIKKKDIYIFVNETELETYEKALGKGYNIIIGRDTISKQRETISNYFDDDEWICSMDDDITDIMENGKSIENLQYLINDFFNHLISNNMTLASCNPCSNPFFAKPTITTDLKFCCGAFKCYINKKHLEKRNYDLLEDYQNTLKHYKYGGGVLRFNYITLKVNYNSAKGGLKGVRTIEKKSAEVERFIKEYPLYAKTKKTKTTGEEISLIKNPKREIVASLWIGDYLNELSELCINSWLKLDYEIHLYIDTLNIPKNLEFYKNSKQLQFFKASDILKYNNKEDILPFADLWRFKMIFDTGKTWLDADMYLLRPLPQQKEIISSEFTFQSGAFKSDLFYVANIGVLRFDNLHSEVLEKTIKKINIMSTKIPERTERMKVFKKVVMKSNYLDVSPPSWFCPISFWNTDQIYKNEPYKTKYNVEALQNDYILEHSYGIHLWNYHTYNKVKQDFSKIEKGSLYDKLLKRITY